MATATPDKPGVYEGLTYEQYDAIRAWRRSVLDVGATHSLAHLKCAAEGGSDKTSAALEFGKALHAAVMEPARFERTVVLGEINPTTNEPYGIDTKKQQEFMRANPGRIVMGKGDRARLIGMGAAIRAHPRARPLLASVKQTELTIVWDDPVTGERCKIRLDALAPMVGLIDLKSTVCAAPGKFDRSLYDYGYHRQAAMYMDGAKAAGLGDLAFNILAVEKEPPYAVAVYYVGPETVAIGRQEYREVLHAIVNAKKTGVWPGYGDDVMQIDVPDWVFKRFVNAA